MITKTLQFIINVFYDLTCTYLFSLDTDDKGNSVSRPILSISRDVCPSHLGKYTSRWTRDL